MTSPSVMYEVVIFVSTICVFLVGGSMPQTVSAESKVDDTSCPAFLLPSNGGYCVLVQVLLV